MGSDKNNEVIKKQLKIIKILIFFYLGLLITSTIAIFVNLKSAYENRTDILWVYVIISLLLLYNIYLYINRKRWLNHIDSILW